MTARPWQPGGRGLLLAIRATPRARRSAVVGIAADPQGRPVLELRLAAPPVEGAANRALAAFLADALGVRKVDVAVVSGAKARLKQVDIAGDPDALAARLEALLQG